ncbi:cation:proton antiporter [Actinomarinicola tropica]|uniref:Cation:proton antiporter n=1 Tax=Actinomarinicola tropica TaxID=2789776 RepID=A0A5Q2RH24_9ACTN|nr:monovalent cation/H(+) antiporter subunit G [Actinomarinicola tropica]QGG96118.1 cation:proton antiporter [Actinomarinicola tropica]
MTEVVSSVLLVTGGLLALLSAVGLHRFRDAIARSHAAGKAAPLGATFVAVAASLQIAELDSTFKMVVALALLLITFPTGVHMVVRAAYRSGTELNQEIEVDELGDALRALDDEGG